MANRNLVSEKAQTRKLYRAGIKSPVMLAKIVPVPRQTISAWISREHWDALDETESVSAVDLAREYMMLLHQMLKEVKEMKAKGVNPSMQTLKEMRFWNLCIKALDEDYDMRGSLVYFSNNFINFVSAAPQDVIPDKKAFVRALQVALPLFLKGQSEL